MAIDQEKLREAAVALQSAASLLAEAVGVGPLPAPPARAAPSAKWLTARQVSEELGVSLTSAYEVIRQAGAQPVLGSVRVSRAGVEAWLRRQQAERSGGMYPAPVERSPLTFEPLIRPAARLGKRGPSGPAPLIKPTQRRGKRRREEPRS